MRPSEPILIAALVAALVQGCTPRCQEVCTKVLDCGLESTRVARDACIRSCQLEEDLYASWDDQEKIRAFRAHKRCIRSESCEAIAEGACYDELLFVFEPVSTL